MCPRFYAYIRSETINVYNKTIEIVVIDSSKSAKTTMQHGLAFWVGGRRVGEPSWNIGKYTIIDGRKKIAHRYTIVVKSSDLYEEVLSDWTGFKNTDLMNKIYSVLSNYLLKFIREISVEEIENTRILAVKNNLMALEDLIDRTTAQKEISNFIVEVTEKKPDIAQEVLNIAVEAVINIEKSRAGTSLLKRLSLMSVSEIGALDKLLDEWSANDILSVMDEIDSRIITLEAISRLCNDSNIDELHTLHPVVTKARWLFGPEYDSVSYVSNVSLTRAMHDLFGKKAQTSDFINSRKRPDLILLPESTISAVCTEEYNIETGLDEIDKILIIELKKGKSSIKREEMQQAQGYVEDLLFSGFIADKTKVYAYVVGDKISPKTSRDNKIQDERGVIHATTYTQLIDTGSHRLFNLKKLLQNHYEDIDTNNIVKRVLNESNPLGLRI